MLQIFELHRSLALLCFALGALACTEADAPEPDESSLRASEADIQTLTLTITAPEDIGQAELMTIASAAEGLAGQPAGARVEADQRDGEATTLTIQLWGEQLDAPETIIEQLRAAHPVLADAPIVSETHAGPPADELQLQPGPDETPEQTRARILDELQEQGVTGEISVEVFDEGEGRRRVEVHVEDTAQSN